VSLKEVPSAKGLDVRQAFMKFHETYYSANLMKLVVLGREPLDVLQQWVVEKFSAVRNKDLQAPDFDGKPYTLLFPILICLDRGSCETCQRQKIVGDGLHLS
jgi:secreted Zn-dependent insulinase-like peptidase